MGQQWNKMRKKKYEMKISSTEHKQLYFIVWYAILFGWMGMGLHIEIVKEKVEMR